jgi:hypothetical protein
MTTVLAPTGGPAAVLNRIAQIQARFEPQLPMRPAAGLDTLSPLGSFGALLEEAFGQTGPTPSGAIDGDTVIATASRYLGVPYLWGGTDPAVGLDCSGFVQRVYRDLGIELPRVSRAQATVGREVPSLALARPGDLIAFGSPVDHIAIYAGEGRIIEAPRRGQSVKFTDLSAKGPVTAIRRVLPEDTTFAATTPTFRLGLAERLGGPQHVGRPPAVFPTAAPLADLEELDLTRTGRAPGWLPESVPFRELFVAAGQRYGLDPRLLAAVGKVESNFRPDAVSPAGAVGVMQFMPATARGMGIDPRDPAQAIDAAGRYLRGQINRFGSVQLGLAAYNAGPGAVLRAGGVPQNRETLAYGPKVLATINGGRW